VNELLERLIATHRAEQARRERIWIAELEQRRKEIARAADIETLRAKLAI
jgi:hypothetical protein